MIARLLFRKRLKNESLGLFQDVGCQDSKLATRRTLTSKTLTPNGWNIRSTLKLLNHVYVTEISQNYDLQLALSTVSTSKAEWVHCFECFCFSLHTLHTCTLCHKLFMGAVSLCLLTVATSRRKALTLSVISAPAADPSTAEGGGAGDLVVRSHGREGLTQ